MEGDPDVLLAKISEAVRSGAIVMSETFDARGSRLSFWTPRSKREANG